MLDMKEFEAVLEILQRNKAHLSDDTIEWLFDYYSTVKPECLVPTLEEFLKSEISYEKKVKRDLKLPTFHFYKGGSFIG